MMLLNCQLPTVSSSFPPVSVAGDPKPNPNPHPNELTPSKRTSPSTFHHNMAIRELSRGPDPGEAFAALAHMLLSGAQPNNHTFPSLLSSCASTRSAGHGREAHAFLLKLGLSRDSFIRTSLIDFYASCGLLADARRVFDAISHKDTIASTALVNGYLMAGHVDDARKLFGEMPEKDVVSWNSMISGLSKRGLFREALEMFDGMLRSGAAPNESTMVSVLSACGQGGEENLSRGRWIHSWIEGHRKGAGFCNVRLGNALVDMYAKCGQLSMARDLFVDMPRKDRISWNVMIGGYTSGGQCMKALETFREMQVMSGVEPDAVTFLSVLPACANLGALDTGKWLHVYIERMIRSSPFNASLMSDPTILSLQTSIIDMYFKCGSVESAEFVFNGLETRSLSSWNAMISGLAMHGHYDKVFHLFSAMIEEGFQPDEITFVGVLSACSHAGLVEIGQQYFSSMVHDYGVQPGVHHYGCMVDLLGRAGHLGEARDLIEEMDVIPDAAIWGSLLNACRAHGNVEMAEYATGRLLEVEPENVGASVMLSNVYAAAGLWDDVAKIRTCLNDHGMKKQPGCTSIEVDSNVHEFLVGDKRHPQTKEIYDMLDEVQMKLEKAGYVSNTSEVLHDVEDEWKEGIVSYHSERLAIAFGLIATKPGTTIRIMKNLNVCRNCHTASKLISKIYKREIIARDHNRFHHFKDGYCSCRDFW